MGRARKPKDSRIEPVPSDRAPDRPEVPRQSASTQEGNRSASTSSDGGILIEPKRALTVREVGKLFPKPLSERAVLRRITRGIDGVKLEADYDGYRYLVRPEAVERFMNDLAAKRRNRTTYLGQKFRTRHERAAKAREAILRL